MNKTPSLYYLVNKTNLVSEVDLKPYQNFSDLELYKVLLQNFNLNEETLLKIIAANLAIPVKKISEIVIDQDFFCSFDQRKCITDRCLPVYEDQKSVTFAFDNPYNSIITELKKSLKKELKILLISSYDFNSFLGIKKNNEQQDSSLLDQLLTAAAEKKASDIHLKKLKDKTTADFRINGHIYPFMTFKAEEERRLLSLIKLNAGLDISLLNLPQDGRINFVKGKQSFDIRVASLPTAFGENLVLRLFNENIDQLALNDLGFNEQNLNLIQRMLKENNGLILVNGATGSGKTTTLYALLKELQKGKNKNIISLEDPVEHVVEGISQSQINPGIDYNFAKGLRAILRQDPDVIMIGEIRDQETAKIALEAAYTGHLVLASLHTSDIASCLLRLASFQLDPFLVAYSLKGIIAQKLVSKLCDNCKIEIKSTFAEKAYQEKGCPCCSYLGFNGRTVLTEIFDLTEVRAYSEINLFDFRTNLNYISFEDDLKNKLAEGIISEKESFELNKYLN